MYAFGFHDGLGRKPEDNFMMERHGKVYFLLK